MNSGIIATAITLLVVILTGVFLIRRRNNRSHSIVGISNPAAAEPLFYQPLLLISFLFFFLFCVIFSTVHYTPFFLPDAASSPYDSVAPLFTTTLIITGVAFFATQILLFVFAWRFRNTRGRVASFIKGSNVLELTWTIIPAIAFIFLCVWGHLLWEKVISPAPSNAVEIDIMGEQFNWHTRYTGRDKKMGRTSFRFIHAANSMGIDTTDPLSLDDFIPLQMHIPTGRPIKLTLRSKDVIHSFFIPFFKTKMDAVPGMTTTLHFTALETTSKMREKRQDPEFNYEIACAELCGRMHFAMKLILVVDEPEEFDRWFNDQKSWMAQQANASRP